MSVLKILSVICWILCLFPLHSAHAVTYTATSNIKNMTSGKDFARVRLDSMSSAEGCSKYDWYILDFADGEKTQMYSMLLTAKATGQDISFQLAGCKYDYPVITHIYN